MHGSDTTPDGILLFDISEAPLLDPPSTETMLQTSERVFGDELASHADAERVGPCELVSGTAIARCVANSKAPLARTVIDYDWLLHDRHAGVRVMSASTDVHSVQAEADTIARSVR